MISILIPSRKRVSSLLRTMDSASKTVFNPAGIEFVVYLDEDDDPHAYSGLRLEIQQKITWVTGPRIVLSNTWNKCAERARGDIFMQGNDDIIFRTRDWDRMVQRAIERVPDRICMVHGNDGSQHPSGRGYFGTHPFVHRKWYETLGYFTAPYFSSDYGDTWTNDLANAINRRYPIPITIEHMHFWLGKAEEDETTKDRLTRHSHDLVDQVYADLMPLRRWDVEKLKAVTR